MGKFSNKKGGNLVKIVCVGEEEGIYVNFPTKRKKKKPNTEKVNHDRRAECSDRDSDCNCKIYSKEKINKKLKEICVFMSKFVPKKSLHIIGIKTIFFINIYESERGGHFGSNGRGGGGYFGQISKIKIKKSKKPEK